MLSSLPVFIINLPQSTDRKAFMKVECESIGISPVFVEAINGRNISEAYISQYCDQAKAKRLFGRELLLGEIGCALSHIKIYQKIVDEKIPYAVILEDDVIFEEGFNETVKSILSSDRNWELVLLGHHKDIHKRLSSPLSIWSRSYITPKSTLNRLASFGFGTYGYIISIKGAKKLLIELDKIYQPIDYYTSNSNIINVYALHPTIISINNIFNTTIDDDKVRSLTEDSFIVIFMKKVKIINAAVKTKNFLKTLKPIKKYK